MPSASPPASGSVKLGAFAHLEITHYMSPGITALYAGLLGLLFLVLCWQVVDHRRRGKIGLGTGGNMDLERAIRVHGNFAEYVPLFLVLLLLAELGGAAGWLLHVLGGSFLLSRVAHAWGLSKSGGTSPGRFYGTLFTWITLLLVALLNLWLALA
jgi:uncharacterized membrane protein YecN with MAPEG domain